MRIAIVTYSLLVGGIESVIFNLAVTLRQKGHYVEVIESQGKGEWNSYFRESGIRVKTFPFNLFTVPSIHIKKIIRYLSSFDFVLLNDSPYAQAGIGLLPENTKAFPVLHLSLESMVRNALSAPGQWNGVICVSPSLRDILLKESPSSSVRYIPNGVSVSGFVHRTWTEPFRILYAGRVEHNQKGVLFLPEIIKGLLAEGINCILDIIGDGPSLKELKDLVRRYSLGMNIIIHGSRPNHEVRSQMNNSHFLLMPSYYEGLPVALLEAMGCGLIPVVSLLEGHTDFIIENTRNGFFGKAGSHESFVVAFKKAVSDIKKLPEISLNSFLTVKEKYNVTEMADAYLSFFNDSIPVEKRNGKIDYSNIIYKPSLPILLSKLINKF